MMPEPLANASFAAGFTSGAAATNYLQFALSYRLQPQLEVVAAFMEDRTTVAGSEARVGRRSRYLMLDYALSSRTDLYAAIDHSRLYTAGLEHPAYEAQNDGAKGYHIGLRHRF